MCAQRNDYGCEKNRAFGLITAGGEEQARETSQGGGSSTGECVSEK